MSSDPQETTVIGGDPQPPPLSPVAAAAAIPSARLRPSPDDEHIPDNYDDIHQEFSPLFSSLEKYLPVNMISSNREEKASFMSAILLEYLPPAEEFCRAKKLREYRQKIMSHYQPLHKELYTLDPNFFFVPSFLKAIKENTEQSFRRIISEPCPGILVFQMFQPKFCEMMISEVENVRDWASQTNFQIMKATKMSNYGAVLDDFGLGSMLDELIDGFISPISKVFFSDALGSTLDSHHGFVVEYGKDRDADLEFVGGELYFRGARCEKHVITDTKSKKESFDYRHILPGQALLHRGRFRHGARATTSGHRVNMILWCRSSVYREIKTDQKEGSNWCSECLEEMKETESQALAARRKELIRIESKTKA